ncbi:AMP-binding protein [uncultured Cocleimonas sp.]|uniref:AMP-binding protein n=1 Tax=uncultured Cocleimonas sp. TaxID=1051587 RepID=UPI00262C906A|nr:AMP-binding protein [uncultured Cocleimonas sp.]
MKTDLQLPSMYDSLKENIGNEANYVPLTPISFLSRTADVYPNHPSLIYGDQQYSWSQTEYRCQQMAHALKKLGLQAHETVSVFAFNTPETFEAHYYVAMAGGVLNTINTRLDEPTITYILEFAETKVLIVDRELLAVAAPGIRNLLEKGKTISVILIDDPLALTQPDIPEDLTIHLYEDLLAENQITKQNYLETQVENELQPLAINFTSGTSGHPKGVVYHHRGSYLMALGTIAGWAVPKHPVYLYTVPLFHCNGWGHAWTMTAMAGTIICTRSIVPKQIFELMKQHRVTHFGGAPIVLNMLANSEDCPEIIADDRTIYCMTAGAPPPAAVLGKMENMGFEVMHVYGLTETYGHILQGTPQPDWVEADAATIAELKARQGVRFPMAEAVQVVNPKTGIPVNSDGVEMGEIITRGNTVMTGYLKNPEETKTAFRDGWFWSGDLAVVNPDGYIQVKDRAKDIIISGGENISSVEIENALYKHEAVGDAAVVAMADEKWGETPCAFIELKKGFKADEAEIIEHCKEHIASFKKPSKVVFGDIPKTATGKIQKYELRNKANKLNN